MEPDTPEQGAVRKGHVSDVDGLRDFLEQVVSSQEIKRSIIKVESGTLAGDLGIFCSRYVVGGRFGPTADASDEPLSGQVVGFEAVRRILSLRDGIISQIETDADGLSQVRTTLAIDIFSLLDWHS